MQKDSDFHQRLSNVRQAMQHRKLHALIQPRGDRFGSEWVQLCEERLLWLCGFSGSAGMAIITHQEAVLFVDGRYTLQASQEIPTDIWQIRNLATKEINDFFQHIVDTESPSSSELPADTSVVIGFDTMLHTAETVASWHIQMATCQRLRFQPLEQNLISQIWSDAPEKESGHISLFDHAQVPRQHKIKAIIDELTQQKVDHFVITRPDNIVWLLNIRGQDIPHTPICHAFAVLHCQPPKIAVFTDCPHRILHELAMETPIDCQQESALPSYIETLTGTVACDKSTTPYGLWTRLKSSGINTETMADPIVLRKVCKNVAEIASLRQAHLNDAAAVVNVLAWLQIQADNAQTPSEVAVGEELLQFRSTIKDFQSSSFETICASGANGAVIHYRATPAKHRILCQGDIVLLDSGGQYLSGTTDVTRTFWFMAQNMKPFDKEAKQSQLKNQYTLVLKAMMAVSRLRWPKPVRGDEIDMVARSVMWQHGLNYPHGTGHGVGFYLGVHEGPQSLSSLNREYMHPGMVVSNEPGFYVENEMGIRLENLLVVHSAQPDNKQAQLTQTEHSLSRPKPAQTGFFETLTFVPFDRRLVDKAYLSQDECQWLNEYHQQCWQKTNANVYLTQQGRDWLKNACQPL